MKNLNLERPLFSKRLRISGYAVLLALSTPLIVAGQIGNTSYDIDNLFIGGNNNVAFGVNALVNTSGTSMSNVAIGKDALFSNTTGSGNSATGYQSLYANTFQHYNTANGYQALFTNQSTANTAIGYQSMLNNNGGTGNVATGYLSLRDNTSGNYNTASGYQALYRNTTGIINTAIGSGALGANIGGSNNVAIGGSALSMNINGTHNVAIGAPALSSNISGRQNVAVGSGALVVNTTDRNVAVGYSAMQDNTIGFNNTAIGSQALKSNISGWNNVAVGSNALLSNTGDNNVGVGFGAVKTGGVTNVGVGTEALSLCTGNSNTGIGHWALVNATSADYNSALGFYSLLNVTSGDYNTSVGYNSMAGVTTESANAGLGSWSNVQTNFVKESTALGHNAIALNSYEVRLGSTTALAVIGTPANYTSSDGRFKTNVSEDVKGLEFIKRLRPVIYNLDTKQLTEHIVKGMSEDERKHYMNQNFEPSTSIRQTGFIAQEVEKAATESGFDFHGVHKPTNEKDQYSLAYATFVVPLVKAIQEQQKMIEDQNAQLEEQKKTINELKQRTNISAVGSLTNADSEGFSMAQNIPNPFTNETSIEYTLPKQIKSATMVIYDLTGKQLSVLPLKATESSITFTSEKLAPGIYIYSIIADGQIMDSKKMVVSEH